MLSKFIKLLYIDEETTLLDGTLIFSVLIQSLMVYQVAQNRMDCKLVDRIFVLPKALATLLFCMKMYVVPLFFVTSSIRIWWTLW